MTPCVEDLISQCVEGHAPTRVIESLEQDYLDPMRVRNYLLRDLASFGIVPSREELRLSSGTFFLSLSESLHDLVSADVRTLLDTYARVYPEYEFVLRTVVGKDGMQKVVS